jgi:sugar transferase EpsL
MRFERTLYARYGKRLLDVCGALTALLLFAPIMAATALMSRWRTASPVIFRQARPGFHERSFVLLKFRTMSDARDKDGSLLPDSQRLSPFGAFLRRCSIDEFPQFINVLRGDMSLVGPRPLLMQYLPFYTEEERIRFMVRPGITGWAQVNGRNAASWDDRLRSDVWYVRNQSLVLDITIIFMTFLKVLARDQVIVDAHATMLNLDEERTGIKPKSLVVNGRY